MISVLVLDSGNSIVKFKRGDGNELEFVHGLKEISHSDINEITRSNAGKLPTGYAIVNDTPYAYGVQAERYGALEPRKRAARYTRDYYGVIAAIALAESYSKNGEYAIFGSHPPIDSDMRDFLLDSVTGFWEVKLFDRTNRFDVVYANSFDEPAGGLWNVVLASDGQHYQHSDVNEGRALVLDIGGRTTDWLAIQPGGEIDYSLRESDEVGIQNVTAEFERIFKRNHRDLFINSDLPIDRVRKAIQTRIYRPGNADPVPCESEVMQAVNIVLNRIANAWRTRAGGGSDFDTIVLTGGGSALLYDYLLPVLNHPSVMLADNQNKLHMANVRGGLKLWKFYEAEGLVE